MPYTRVEAVGSMIPHADPPYLQGQYAPYLNETHYALQKEVRAFVDEYIVPHVDEWDEAGEIDPNLYTEFGKRGYLCAVAGQSKYPTEYTDIRIKSVPPEKFDVFHEAIVMDEVARAGSGGVIWFLAGGYNISVPAIFKFASEEVKKRVLPDLLSGRKRSCLCITEPDAGSDVANLTTEAVKTEGGYKLTGTKKWITNGIFADYFVVACRTGGKGAQGVSVVLAEKALDTTGEALERHKILTQGMRGSGTTLMNFDELFVPSGNLLGKENQGFKVVMSNFNHERLILIAQVTRMARNLIEDSYKWATERETFNTKLINHAVIRQKLGVMSGRVEALQAWLNDLLFQLRELDERESTLRLAGPIATAKGYATQTLELCAREASQIFGGLSYTRGGKAGRVERIYREVRAYAIPGGSEEIMLDLGVRQTLKASRALGAKI